MRTAPIYHGWNSYICILLIRRKFSSIKQISLLAGLAYLFLAIFAILWNGHALLIFGLALMVMEITEILLVNTLQNEIKDEGRATIMSFYGAGQNIVMVLFSLVYALLAGIYTLQQIYLIIAIYGIAGGLSFGLFGKIIQGGR